MPQSTFKESTNYLVMELPEGITHDELKDQLEKNLFSKLKKNHSGLLIDVTALNENDEHFRSVGSGVGQFARDKIDPKLESMNIKKVAFVSSNSRFHGSESADTIIIKDNAPVKRYFSDREKAEKWLNSHSSINDITIVKVHAEAGLENFKKELENLVDHLGKMNSSDGVLVDVSELTKNEDNFKRLGNEIGQWARKTIDPKLKKHINKIAFVDPSDKYHGRESKSEHPIIGPNAPMKHYFDNYEEALNWLQS